MQERAAGAVAFHDVTHVESIEILRTSTQCGWHNVYVYTAAVRPFSSGFSAVDSLLIVMALDGDLRGTLRIGNQTSEIFLQPGFIFCLPPDISFEVSICTHARVISIYIPKDMLKDIAFEFSVLTNTLFNLNYNFHIVDDFLESFINSINNALYSGEQFSAFEVQYVARAIVARMIAKYSTRASDDLNADAGLSYPVLQKVFAFIDDNLHQRISAEQLAPLASVGGAQFSRLFKRATDVTLHQYIIKRRVDKARNLLADTTMPIIEIAQECGFADQVHLTRFFGRIMGVSPAQFRKKQR